ncbi:MAG: hypothetical protein QG622_1987 [Actinomycetota bacterium]|nr:hypothetical protein [Actinomycetota bacterium]
MFGSAVTRDFLAAETQALLTRIDGLRAFVEQDTMVPAALLLPRALVGIDALLATERSRLRQLAEAYLVWLQGIGAHASPAEQQRRFVLLRLRLNDHLSQLDLFSEVIVQRSEMEIGAWLSGMDVAAADALCLNDGRLGDAVPIICYLARGPGAAIRRAHTRLPGGVQNPVAIVRVPRERMAGHGIASSLFHEVGHQGAALLDLLPSLRAELADVVRESGVGERFAWKCWQRWVSEIVADFWSVAKLGIGSTLGLMAVVSLPRPFVFRINLTDPHPFPWIRVLISAAFGQHLYPDQQWQDIGRIWCHLYPLENAAPNAQQIVRRLLPTLSDLAARIAGHRPPALDGVNLSEALAHPSRRPVELRRLRGEAASGKDLAMISPVLRFALLGQARWDRRVSAADENREVRSMLTTWARESTLRMAEAAGRQRITSTGQVIPHTSGRTVNLGDHAWTEPVSKG